MSNNSASSSVSDNDMRDTRCLNNSSGTKSSPNPTNSLSGLEHLLPPGGLNGTNGASLAAAAAMAASSGGGGGEQKVRDVLSYIYQYVSRQQQQQHHHQDSGGEQKVSAKYIVHRNVRQLLLGILSK